MNPRRFAAAVLLLPSLCGAGQTLDWALRPVFGLQYIWGVKVDSKVDGKCADAVTFSWGPSRGQGMAMVNRTGREPRKCGGSGHIGGLDGTVPPEPFQAKWVDWTGKEQTATVDVASALAPVKAYGGNLQFLINNDHLELWFEAPDKSKGGPTATFWPKQAPALAYSSDPAVQSTLWTFELRANVDRRAREALTDFWLQWGGSSLNGLQHAGRQKRRLDYGFPQQAVYELLPREPLEVHWTDPAGERRDFSIPVADLLAGQPIGGGRFVLQLYPSRIELWFQPEGALLHGTKQAPKLVYASPAK